MLMENREVHKYKNFRFEIGAISDSYWYHCHVVFPHLFAGKKKSVHFSRKIKINESIKLSCQLSGEIVRKPSPNIIRIFLLKWPAKARFKKKSIYGPYINTASCYGPPVLGLFYIDAARINQPSKPTIVLSLNLTTLTH